MKSNPTVTGVVGAFARLGMSSERRPVLVSVLVSVWTPPLQKPLPHTRLGMEAEVGIERIPPSTSHSKSTAYGIADVLTLRRLHFMSRITPPDFS